MQSTPFVVYLIIVIQQWLGQLIFFFTNMGVQFSTFLTNIDIFSSFYGYTLQVIFC
jgi:hypothetical protein